MKLCQECYLYYQEQIMACQQCRGPLTEVSLQQALKITERQALQERIGGKKKRELPDAYKQYHIRSYLKNRSLFLDFDIHKNRLKHGKQLKRFFIAPINITAIVNIPWFIFNVITSNLFYMENIDYCPFCSSKCNKARHTKEECEYNIEYCSILNNIISGNIVDTKNIYQAYAQERRNKGLKSAYHDLFNRKMRTEFFWDLMSVTFSVFLWLYLAVFISYPMFKAMILEVQQYEVYTISKGWMNVPRRANA